MKCAAFLSLFLGLGLSGCCPAVAHFCGLGLSVSPASGDRFPDGSYELAVIGETSVKSAKCEIVDGRPQGPCQSPNGPFALPVISGSGPGLVFYVDIQVGQVDAVPFYLSRNGMELKAGKVPVEHKTTSPNGPGCGMCQNTSGSITF